MGGIAATLPGACSVCGQPIRIGDMIRKHGYRWAHDECVQFAQNKGAVESGERYRAQPQKWKRRKRPNPR